MGHKNFPTKRAEVVVKWSACSPCTPTIPVKILLGSTIFCKIVIEKNKNNQKEAAVCLFKNKHKNFRKQNRIFWPRCSDLRADII